MDRVTEMTSVSPGDRIRLGLGDSRIPVFGGFDPVDYKNQGKRTRALFLFWVRNNQTSRDVSIRLP